MRPEGGSAIHCDRHFGRNKMRMGSRHLDGAKHETREFYGDLRPPNVKSLRVACMTEICYHTSR